MVFFLGSQRAERPRAKVSSRHGATIRSGLCLVLLVWLLWVGMCTSQTEAVARWRMRKAAREAAAAAEAAAAEAAKHEPAVPAPQGPIVPGWVAGSTVNPGFPIFAYLPYYRLQTGFPYHYYFENGVTHLVFHGLTMDGDNIVLRGFRQEDHQLPRPAEWAQLREVSRRYKGKLMVSIGGAGDRSKGLSTILRLYFYRVAADKPRRKQRLEMLKQLGRFLVEWDFDGVDIDWHGPEATTTPYFWVGVRNLARDIREQVEKWREIKRKLQRLKNQSGRKEDFAPIPVYSRFLVSITMAPNPTNMAVLHVGNLARHVDIIHWMVYNAPIENSFLLQKGHTDQVGGMLGGSNTESLARIKKQLVAEEASGRRRTDHEVGHGPQYGSFYHHSSLNYTISVAMQVAESRLYAHEGKNLPQWGKEKRISMEDQMVEDEVPMYYLREDEYVFNKEEVERALHSFCSLEDMARREAIESTVGPGWDGETIEEHAPLLDETEATRRRRVADDHRISDQIVHTLAVPFFAVDLRRGPLAFRDVMAEVQEKVYQLHGRGEVAERIMKDIYILDGMGFDHGPALRQKMRVAAQLGFGGMTIWEIGQDLHPEDYTPLRIRPLRASSSQAKKMTADEEAVAESTVDAQRHAAKMDEEDDVGGAGTPTVSISGGVDLSLGRSMVDGLKVPLAPEPPTYSLLRAIRDEIQAWSTPEGRAKACQFIRTEMEAFLHEPATYLPRFHRFTPVSSTDKMNTAEESEEKRKSAEEGRELERSEYTQELYDDL